MDLLKRSSPYFPRFSVRGMLLVNLFSRFTKTTDFFTKTPGFKGKGSWMTSELCPWISFGNGHVGHLSTHPARLGPTWALGTRSPRTSRRWNFEISVTGAVTRHGVINWEEFGEKFWWVVLHSTWSTKKTQKISSKTSPNSSPNSSGRISPGHKNLSPQSRSGECQA